jgi:nucleoside-diphosphate-sugar epimerase
VQKALITGGAGFIGSTLADLLSAEGIEVVIYDNLSSGRREFVSDACARPGVEFVQGDVLDEELVRRSLEGCDTVFHLAGQPGVRPSWGAEFGVYLERNVAATQRLLETLRELPIRKLVFASSSSVYGDAEAYPTSESLRPQPVSPYGVTKLAAEHLCELYRANFGVPSASLRLFTVYGPRQRPDMAFSRLVHAAVYGETFELYGDGEQTRDFTFVGDVVKAMLDVALSDWCGVANIGGGSRTAMYDVVELVQELAGPVTVERGPRQHGDVRHTAADTRVARHAFGYAPATTLAEGLAAMVAWKRASSLLSSAADHEVPARHAV